MKRSTTMLDLITALQGETKTDAEVAATVAYLVNSGRVRPCGIFKGARIALGPGETFASAA